VDNTQDILANCTDRVRRLLPATGNETGSVRDAAYYLAHTAYGAGIRKLAEASGAHPSTVTRAVQRIESRRDDPLFDRIVAEIEAAQTRETKSACGGDRAPAERVAPPPLSEDDLLRAAKRFLRRLSEPGAFLIIAPGAEKAGIFCAANEHRRPIALLPVTVAVEFLRQDWIRVVSRGSASVRYRITDAGRAYLKRALMDEQEARRPGLAEAQSPFLSQHREMGERLFADPETGEPGTMAVNLGESPIGWLARRKGPDGKPFLTPEEVDAAEKLRADFEAAQIGPSVAQDWRKFLTPGDRFSGSPRSASPGEGAAAARERVTRALAVLGPGLADVALRACCFLEGLEGCERRLGWSARSGKVVLKLALQRLVDHYGLAPFRD
jgi:hypothetical protein